MNWVLGAVVGVLGVGLLVVLVLIVVGTLTPSGHKASRSVSYRASPDTVWRAITDWGGHAAWRSKVRAIERLPDRNGHPVWRETRRRGDALTSEVVELDEAKRRMVTRIVDEGAFGGTWTWEVGASPDGAGSLLTITEDGEIYNPVFRAIGTWLLDMRATMDRLHRDLKAKLGEPPPVFGD